MELSYAIARYEQALELLPVRWQQLARRLPDWRKAQAEEFRLRTGRPMTVVTCEGEILVSDELPRALVTQSDLEQLCDMVTGYSRYAVSETLSKGYLIGRGGFRVGVCGTAVLRDGVNTNLRDISSVTVRISRQVRGTAEPLLTELWGPEGFRSTLLLAPPGAGQDHPAAGHDLRPVRRQQDAARLPRGGGGRAGRAGRHVPGRATAGGRNPHRRAGRLSQGDGDHHAAAGGQPADHRGGRDHGGGGSAGPCWLPPTAG